MYNKKIKILIMSLILLVMSGCASFEKNELARLDNFPDVSQYEIKPSIYVDYSFYVGKPNENPNEVPQARETIRPIIEKAINDSQLFSNYYINDSNETKASEYDYTIKIDIYNHGDQAMAFVAGFITGYTLGIIPSAATDNYIVELQSIDKNGNVLSKHTNQDAVRTWLGIIFIPMMNNTPQKAMHNTLMNQISVALKELIESGVIKYTLKDLNQNQG